VQNWLGGHELLAAFLHEMRLLGDHLGLRGWGENQTEVLPGHTVLHYMILAKPDRLALLFQGDSPDAILLNQVMLYRLGLAA